MDIYPIDPPRYPPLEQWVIYTWYFITNQRNSLIHSQNLPYCGFSHRIQAGEQQHMGLHLVHCWCFVNHQLPWRMANPDHVKWLHQVVVDGLVLLLYLARKMEATVAEMGGSFLSFLLSFSFSHSAMTSWIEDGNSFDCCFGPLIETCNKGFSKSFLIRDCNLFFCHFRILSPLPGQVLLTGQLRQTSVMNGSMG